MLKLWMCSEVCAVASAILGTRLRRLVARGYRGGLSGALLWRPLAIADCLSVAARRVGTARTAVRDIEQRAGRKIPTTDSFNGKLLSV
jgi:hypothetical protein